MANILLSISNYLSSNPSSIVIVPLFFFVRYLVLLHRGTKLPKGPIGLPLLGYLPFIGKSPHYTLWNLGKKYGSIYTLPLGKSNIVILNDWDSVRDAFRKEPFLGRPEQSSFSLLTGVKSLIDDDSYSWREDRRVFENLFKTCTDSSFICRNLLIELKSLLIYLKKNNNLPIEIRTNTSKFINKLFYSLIFGKNFIAVKSLFDSTLFVKISVLSLYPSWLAKLCYGLFDVCNQYHFALFLKFFRNETKSHYKTISPTSIRDLIDGYILEMQTKKVNLVPTTMSIDKLRANCQVFLSFGNEAFLSSIEWSLICVAHFQNYQKILCNEISQVVEANRVPEFKDELRMPFTKAFLNEVLRWKTVIPFSFIRRAVEDATILGQFIPKNTLVVANIFAVHHDHHIWENPFHFDPYRFLSDDGLTFIEREEFMPFSLGKRSCVAEPFVRKMLFIYLVSILQRFTISIANTGEPFDEEFNLTVRPKGNVKLMFRLNEIETTHHESSVK